jgi:hypothetical protein
VLRPGGHLILSATNRGSLQRVLDPWFNPLWAPLKNRIVQRVSGGEAAHARTHSLREMDRLVRFAGLEKVESSTTGFGPFTFFKYKLFPGASGAWLHERLEGLAGGRGGYACLVQARKPIARPESENRKDGYRDNRAA